MTATDYRMTRRNIFIGAAASLICAPAIVRAASLMPVRGLPLQLITPKRRILKTMGDWYQFCFYNNLDNDLKAGRDDLRPDRREVHFRSRRPPDHRASARTGLA